MMSEDAAEKQAREILARFPDNWSPAHREICAAVAGALREQANSVYDAFEFTGKQDLDGARVEITKLKAELEAARAEWKELNEHRLEAWHKYFEMKVECDELRKQVEQAAERQRELANAIAILTKRNGWDAMMTETEYRLVKAVKIKYTILGRTPIGWPKQTAD